MTGTSPNVMVIWHAAPVPFAPPKLHDCQWTGVLEEHLNLLGGEKDTRLFSIPRGEFDLASTLRSQNIPRPDWLFVCIDATTPYFARNLSASAARKFLCLGDTHHMPAPITRLLPYATAERWDGIIFTNNVRHSHWFSRVNNATHYFEPGMFALELPQSTRVHADQRQGRPVFYGQLGGFHPRRARLMTPLINQGLVSHISGSVKSISDQMASASACINVTLNSDLNSRVFEIAQSGCLQIIDRLSAKNGFGSVLVPGHNCLVFDTAQELEELVRNVDLLAEIGPKIGANLRYEWESHWGINVLRKRLAAGLALDQANFIRAPTKPLLPIAPSCSLNSLLSVYEMLLELHRSNEDIEALVEGASKEFHQESVSDLPRLRVVEREHIISSQAQLKLLVTEKSGGEAEVLRIS